MKNSHTTEISSYDIHGEAEESILFIHGFPNNKEIWDRIIDKLKCDFKCYAIDLPNFGSSPVIEGLDMSIHNLAQSIKLFIDKNIKEKTITIVAHD